MVETTYAVAFALAVILSVIVVWRALRARPRQGAGWLAVAMTGVTWWSATKLAEVLVAEFESVQMLFNALHWIGVWVVAIGVLGFGLALGGRAGTLTRARIAALSVVPALSVVAWLGDPRVVELLVTSANVPRAVVGGLVLMNGTLDWFEPVALVYLYGLAAVGTVFVLETVLERPKRDPSRVLLVIMIAVPWSVNLLSELDAILYPGFDPTVFGFVVTGVAGIAAIDRFRLFDVPFVRSRIVEQLSTPVLVYGRDYRLYDYNDRAVELLGLEPAHVGEDIREVLAGTSVPVTDGGAEEWTDPASRLDGTRVSIPCEDEDTRHFLVKISRIDGGARRELGYAIQLSDITDRHRQRQRLEQQNDRLERFASVVSHDLRNPLNVASGRVRLARSEGDSDSEHLAEAARAHDRMEALIGDLLALARHGNAVEDTEQVSLETLSTRCWHGFETDEATLVTRVGRSIHADRDRLRQMLANLLRNAIEHGGRDVTVTVGELDDRDGFYVADDGPGIDAEDPARVFERGYSTAEDGTGFGLAIVEEIASAHGWEVRATGSESGGARFEVTGVEMG